MALEGPAITPFLPEGLQPFEEALRKRTPSPSEIESPVVPYSTGLSTRELQALYKRQTNAFPTANGFTYDGRRSTSTDGQAISDEEVLPAPNIYRFERPLDTARRHSASYESVPVLKAPTRTVRADRDPVFGLDIRDPFGWSFQDQTPYDVLLPSPSATSPSPRHSYLSDPRRSSTPSLTSSPAASSATMSTLSSIQTPSAPGPSYAADYTMQRRRVASMNDMQVTGVLPAAQPIPLGKSRMNNELQVESSPETVNGPGRRPSFYGMWGRSNSSSKASSVASGKEGKQAKAKAPARPSAQPLPRRSTEPAELKASAQGQQSWKSRHTMSLPKLKGKSPSPNATPRMPSVPPPSKGSKDAPRMEPTRSKSSFSIASLVPRSRMPPPPPQGPRAPPLSASTSSAAVTARTPSPTTPTNPPGLVSSQSLPALKPALPIVSSKAMPAGLNSEGMDPRMSKRQSQDLLYKKASTPSLRSAAESGPLRLVNGMPGLVGPLAINKSTPPTPESRPASPYGRPLSQTSRQQSSKSAVSLKSAVSSKSKP